MNEQEQRALMALVLMAAAADGRHDPREQAQMARIAASLGGSGLDVRAIQEDVTQQRLSLTQAAGGLTTPELKKAAYESCAAVCSADGAHDAAEQAFLAALATALGLDAATTASFNASANALATAPVAAVSSIEPPAAQTSTTAPVDLDGMILNYATLNGALEILPDSLATMAILPLQMRMVYRIGKAHGIELDKASIKELVAAAGVGMTSQFVEQIGVSIVGRLFGRGLLGSLLGSVASQSISSGMSFATTYALGRLAIRYYGGGRTLSTEMLKATYDGLLQEGRSLQGQHFLEIQERARTLNIRNINELMRDVLA